MKLLDDANGVANEVWARSGIKLRHPASLSRRGASATWVRSLRCCATTHGLLAGRP